MLVKVRENLVGSCAKNSSDAQLAWRRVAIEIDSGVCDSVTWPEHVPDHEVHESLESKGGESFSICHRRADAVCSETCGIAARNVYGRSCQEVCGTIL